MSLPTFNTKSPTIKRILKEASELQSNPDPTLHAAPLESNLFEWHFTLQGPPSSPYAHGIYHGRIVLPPTYPLRPPSFRFLTPSGRFEVNREICLSISGHHEETWQPAWGIRTALWALRAFMEGGAKGQVGGMDMPEGERRRLAGDSRGWRCAGCGGRSNAEVLAEEEQRGKELEAQKGEGGERKKKVEEEVPEELRFGFRDEMGGEGEAREKGKGREKDDERKDADGGSGRRESVHFAGPLDLRSSKGLVQVPVAASPLSTRPTTAQMQQQAVQAMAPSAPSLGDGVPAWVDKAIAGVVGGLLIMLIKKIL